MNAETVALVLAIAFAVQTVVLCVVLLRLIPVLREVNELVEKMQDVVKHLDGITANLETASRGVRNVEERVRGVVSRVMDEVEPPVRQLAALASGIRTTVQALLRHAPTGNGIPAQAITTESETERGVR